MNPENHIGKVLIVTGIVLLIAGVIFLLPGKIPFLGKLPGDFAYKSKNFSFYFPLMTSLIASIILSLLLYVIRNFF
jgi:hypothetical protein